MKIVKAYAKINVGLKIFPLKKCDTKHELDGIFILCKKIWDLVYIKPAKSTTVKYYDKFNHRLKIDDCLVKKTINYLKNKYDKPYNYCVKITKQIPIKSGLGGGSSDAAVVINHFVDIYGEVYLDLIEITQILGSDIPFFLTRYETARVREYGNNVTPLPKFNFDYSLILSSAESSTKCIFELLSNDKKYVSTANIDLVLDKLIYGKELEVKEINDLNKYILQSNPELLDEIKKHENAFFTGSGSTIIVINKRGRNDKN